MVKKALCCGLNYPNEKHQLYGCINDCLNWAKLVENNFGFDEIRVLIDQNPDGTHATAPTQIPTRANLLAQLGWLCSGAEPGDSLIFYYAGHGTQVKDSNGYGSLQEALVPEDFANPDQDGNPPLVFEDEMHALFARLPAGSFLTVILDCCHGAGMLDVPCSVDTRQRPPKVLQTCSKPGEVQSRNEAAWSKNPHAYARPRFVANVSWRGAPRQKRTAEGEGAHLGKMTLNSGVTSFCFAASLSNEVALDANIKAQQQGMMSFCLLEALAALRHRCTYEQLLARASEIADDIREKYMPTMDQHIQMTFCPNSPPTDVVFLDARYATVAQHRLNQQAKLNERGMSQDGPSQQHDRPTREVSTDFIPKPTHAHAPASPMHVGQSQPQSQGPPPEPTREPSGAPPAPDPYSSYGATPSYGAPPPYGGASASPAAPAAAPYEPPPDAPNIFAGFGGGLGNFGVGSTSAPAPAAPPAGFGNLFGVPNLFGGGGAPTGFGAPAGGQTLGYGSSTTALGAPQAMSAPVAAPMTSYAAPYGAPASYASAYTPTQAGSAYTTTQAGSAAYSTPYPQVRYR